MLRDMEAGYNPEYARNAREYAAAGNFLKSKGRLSPTGRVSTAGKLSRDAQKSAKAARIRAEAAGTPYGDKYVAAHLIDPTWTNDPEPLRYDPQSRESNSSIAGQSKNYPINYKPSRFMYEGDSE